MGGLEVDPSALRAASSAAAHAASRLGALGVGDSLRSAASGVAELQTNAACLKAAATADSNFSQLGQGLGSMADSLGSAASRYEETDTTQADHVQRAGQQLGN